MHFVYIGYGIAISILMLMDWPHLLPLCLSYSLFWRKGQSNQKWLQYSTLCHKCYRWISTSIGPV